ncbi:MAG: diaminopimelate decarboxylase [Planctomycetes bacterium]|nr:diaminopimelate decarboxylase [Planctomycetota bacterium]
MKTYDEIKKIEVVAGSPFYIFNEKEFVNNFDNITKAFGSRYEKFVIGYSFKTNYIPYMCNIIRKKGGFAEVVSRMEYDLALKIGFDPKNIIFNGPMKHYEDIELALDNQSIVNLDCFPEIDHVSKYAAANPDKSIEVGIRVNMNLSDDSGASRVHGDIKIGRFGFSTEESQMVRLLESLPDNVKVISLHGHTTSIDRSTWCYKTIAQTLCDIAVKHWPDTIRYINIGGGIYGYIPPEFRFAETPSFDDYAADVAKVLNNDQWAVKQKPFLVLEPGISMASNALSFITKVISVKAVRGKTFVTVDGSAFNTKPTFHSYNMPHYIIKQADTDQTAVYNVVGSTCMEKDVMLTEVTNKKLERDDYIQFDNVGAYTNVFTPPFINVAPAIVVADGSDYKLIRNRQKAEDVFKDYLFEG